MQHFLIDKILTLLHKQFHTLRSVVVFCCTIFRYLKNCGFSLLYSFKVTIINKFHLYVFKEKLSYGIIPTIAFPIHMDWVTREVDFINVLNAFRRIVFLDPREKLNPGLSFTCLQPFSILVQ